jgi:hypothetical protein
MTDQGGFVAAVVEDLTEEAATLKESNTQLLATLEECALAWSAWQYGVPHERYEDVPALARKLYGVVKKARSAESQP